MDFLYNLIGALAATWILYNLTHIILFKFLDTKTAKYVSFIGSLILILCVTSLTVGFVNGFILYTPLLFVWFVTDLVKMRKSPSN